MSLLSMLKCGVVDVKHVFPSASARTIVYLNPFTYNHFREHLIDIENVDSFRVDGIFMTFVLRAFGVRVPERQSFDLTSLAPYVFDKCVENNYKLYICGGSQSDIEKFIAWLRFSYPTINLCGFQNGYFSDDEIESFLKDVQMAAPDVVLLGLGGIKQESIASRLAPLVDSHIMTCGAFVSQTARRGDYYPPLVKRFGFRWAYRFIKEPRVIKRVIIHYPVFLVNVARDYFNDLCCNSKSS